MTMKTLLSTASLALLLASAATASQAQVKLGHLADYSGATSDVGTPVPYPSDFKFPAPIRISFNFAVCSVVIGLFSLMLNIR